MASDFERDLLERVRRLAPERQQELRYLVEKGRLPAEVLAGVETEVHAETVTLAAVDRATPAALAEVPRTAVPDLPDRITAATAVQLGAPLVTCDRHLPSSPVATI